MIKTTAMILDEFKTYANPAHKLARLAAGGTYIPIVKGLYETDRSVPGYLLAGSIYGPSYLSFEFALSYHRLIPEAVYTFTSATFEKKKKKTYQTAFGTFTYRDVPAAAFPLEQQVLFEGSYAFRIASPEKALCDKLFTLKPVANQKELERLLFEDLRIDPGEFAKLSPEIISGLSEHYHSTNVDKLGKLMRRKQP